jgi:hypothetical protein
MAIRTAAGGLVAAAILAFGAAGASAFTAPLYPPNPGTNGYNGALATPSNGHVVTGAKDVYPTYNGPATNDPNDGPQTANVPTLAWAGEDVKLVACDSIISPTGAGQSAAWTEDYWTGDQFFPGQFNGGTNDATFVGTPAFFAPTDLPENNGKGCTTATISDTHAGLEVIQLDVTGSARTDETNNGVQGDPGTTIHYAEQFVVIWLQANTPVLTEASVSSISTPGGTGTIDQLSKTGVTNLTGTSCIYDQNSMGAGGFAISGPFNCTGFLGDPSGNGVFNPSIYNDQFVNDPQHQIHTPSTDNGLLQVKVTGFFPVEDLAGTATNADKFAPVMDSNGNVQLPSEWPGLAALISQSSAQGGVPGSSPGSDPDLWDIHGGPTNADTHPVWTGLTGVTPCPTDAYGWNAVTQETPTLDAVNNCLGGDQNFSRVFGDVTSNDGNANNTAGIGPYDPEAPDETLMSDGRLNADDAPMPALPVYVNIAPNAGVGTTDLGGVGGLYGVSKELIYSHDFDGNTTTGASKPGNLYNPFYGEYIPSTARGYTESSGVTGPPGEDFPGFDATSQKSPYWFWQALDPSSQNTGGSTICLKYQAYDPINYWLNGPTYYQNPDQDQNTTVLVYTDERGEAYVDYNPGQEFYLDHLIAPPPASTVAGGTDTSPNAIDIDGNGACDLQSLYGQEIGYSNISAQAAYPFKGTEYDISPSNTVTKTVDSLWSKTLTSYPKGNQSATNGTGPPVTIFVATADNINGAPFANEIVCFNVQSDVGSAPGVLPYDGPVFSDGLIAADTSGQTDIPEIEQPFENYYCVVANDLGEAGIEVAGSNAGVDVSAYYYDEGLYRDLKTTLGDPSQTSGNVPPGIGTVVVAVPNAARGGSSGGAASGGSTSTGSSSTGGGSTSGVTPLATAHAAKFSLAFARMIRGNVLSVDVVSAAAKTKMITIHEYRGKRLIRTLHVVVKTNKTVKIHLGHGKISRVKVSL